METFEAFHAVTDRPMKAGQVILFDETHHSGVWKRVMDRKKLVEEIYSCPANFDPDSLEHHTCVALRELALEEIRQKEHPEYPSRMACLYVTAERKGAEEWADYFAGLGRPVYSVVRVSVNGRCFMANADNCFRGTPDKEENLRLARYYWEHPWNPATGGVFEMLVDGTIRVEEILKQINRNLPEQ